MAVRFICDGCEKPAGEGEQFDAVGFVIKRHYCPDCREVVDGFLTERDEVHTKAAKVWADGMKKARAAFVKKHADFKLPDES